MAAVFEVTFPTQLALGLSLSLLRVLYLDPLTGSDDANDATYVDCCYVTHSLMTAQILPGDVLVDCNGVNLLSSQGSGHPSALHTRDTFVKAIVGAALPRTIRVFRLPGMHPQPTTIDGYAAHTVRIGQHEAETLLRGDVIAPSDGSEARSRTPLPPTVAAALSPYTAMTPLGDSPSGTMTPVPGKERYIVKEVAANGDGVGPGGGGHGADGPGTPFTSLEIPLRSLTFRHTNPVPRIRSLSPPPHVSPWLPPPISPRPLPPLTSKTVSPWPLPHLPAGYGFGYGLAVTDRLDQPLTFTQSVKTPR